MQQQQYRKFPHVTKERKNWFKIISIYQFLVSSDRTLGVIVFVSPKIQHGMKVFCVLHIMLFTNPSHCFKSLFYTKVSLVCQERKMNSTSYEPSGSSDGIEMLAY